MKNVIIVSALALMVAACAKDNDPVNNARQATNDKDIQSKNFVSECKTTPVEGGILGVIIVGTNLQSGVVAYRFDGANISRTTRLFANTNCEGDTAVQFEEKGTVNIQPDKRTADLGKFIDIEYGNVVMSTPTAAGVEAANNLSMCGQKNWDTASSRDVTGNAKDKTCYGTAVPRHISTIYRYDAGNLYWGEINTIGATGTDEAHRPTNLDMTDKYSSTSGAQIID